MNRIHLLVLLVLGATGCTSFKDDIETICDAPDKIGDTSKMKPNEKLQKVGEYIDEHVKSATGRDFLSAMQSTGRGGRNKLVRIQAAKFGINPCHFADQP